MSSDAKQTANLVSSGNTLFLKRIMPILGPAFFGPFFIYLISTTTKEGLEFAVMVAFLIAAEIILYTFLRKNSFLLADEVYDCGDYLLIRMNGQEQRVFLADVACLICRDSRFPEVILCLKNNLNSIRFLSRFGALPFGTPPPIQELISRIENSMEKGAPK